MDLLQMVEVGLVILIDHHVLEELQYVVLRMNIKELRRQKTVI
jgi:hypothetical protein